MPSETAKASLGYVTSYGAARRGGYQGTYEEWCALMAEVADHLEENIQLNEDSQAAKAAAETAELEAEGAALTAESWAKGTKGGTDVPSTDPAYHDNAKYYAGEAEGQKDLAAQLAAEALRQASFAEDHSKDAEAYAAGTRGGDPVESGDDAYQNNAKYYSEQSSGFADDAAGSASDAEAWAKGTKNGTDVPSTDPTYHNNAKYWSEQAEETAEDIEASSAQIAQNASDIGDLKTQIKDVESALSPVFNQQTVESTSRGYWSYSEGGVSQAVDSESGSYYKRPAIEIPERTKIRVENSRYYNSNTSRPIIIVDSQYNILAAYSNDDTLGNTDYEFISPSGAKYILLTQYQSSAMPRVYVFEEYEEVATKEYVDSEINKLETQTEYHAPYTYTWFAGGITSSGGNNTLSNRIRTSYTEIINDNIAVEIPEGYKVFIYLYSGASSDSGLGYGTFGGTVTDYTTVSGECKPSLDYPTATHFRVCAAYINNDDISIEAGDNIKISSGFDRFYDIEHNIDALKNYDVIIQNSVFVNASPSMFNKMGICGASWDCGYYYDTASHVQKHVKQSWGANLARNHGNTCNIYARQSMNTRTYLDNTNCLPALLADNPCGMYYIGLGGNDAEDLGLSYLGTISDITPDYTQNPDTFYGNYARIVEQIMNKAPNARIICAMYYDADVHNATRGAFYNAVVEIAEHYNLPHFNWADDSWYKNTVYTGLLKNHPTAPQLSGIAYAFDRIFSKITGRDKWYDYFVAYTGFDFLT